MRYKWGLIPLVVATVGATALGFSEGDQDEWFGRITPTHAANQGLRYALFDGAIQNASAYRLDTMGNALVDFGAHVDADTGTGYDVHVYFNFEPLPGGTRIGDIEAHVLVDYAGTPVQMLSVMDPTPVDDLTVPAGGPDVMEFAEFWALLFHYLDAEVSAHMADDFAAGRELYGTRCVPVSAEGWSWVIDVNTSFRKPNGKLPPPGQREVWARVIHDGVSGMTWVDSVWTE